MKLESPRVDHQARLRLAAEGVVATYIHDLAAGARPRRPARRLPSPAVSPRFATWPTAAPAAPSLTLKTPPPRPGRRLSPSLS